VASAPSAAAAVVGVVKAGAVVVAGAIADAAPVMKLGTSVGLKAVVSAGLVGVEPVPQAKLKPNKTDARNQNHLMLSPANLYPYLLYYQPLVEVW